MKDGFTRRAVATLVLMLSPAALFAGTLDQWDTGLQQVTSVLSGTTASVIGILCIVGAGIALAVTEGQAIKRFFWIIAGIGVAIKAEPIAAGLFGVTPTVGGAIVWIHDLARSVAAVVHGVAPWMFS